MRLPADVTKRYGLYRNVIRSSEISREDRKARYRRYRSWYLTGSDTADRVRHNKLQEHVQFSSSYLYDPNSVRFGTSLPLRYGDLFMEEEEAMRHEMHRIWDDSPDPITFGVGVDWAHVWDTVVFKVFVSENTPTISLVPDTSDIGVLHEDQDLWEDQEAIVHWYVMDIARLARVLDQQVQRKLITEDFRERILNAADTYAAPMSEPQSLTLPPTVQRIILASASPTMVGQVQNLSDTMLAVPRVSDRVVPLAELWIWDDAADDYRVVTNFLPTEDILWEPLNPLTKGDHPFYGLTLGPTPGYLWGVCPLEQLVGLQQWQDVKINELNRRDELQIRPPKFFKGFTGITDEIMERLDAPGGFITNGNPTSEVTPFMPPQVAEPFGMLDRIDLMFERQGGLPRGLRGEAQPGIRSGEQAGTQAQLGAGPTLRRAMLVERELAQLATAKFRLHREIYKHALIKGDGAHFLLSQVPEEIRIRVWGHSQSPLYAQRTLDKAVLAITHKAITPEDFLTLLDLPMADILAAKARRLAKSQSETQDRVLRMKEEEAKAKILKATKP